MQTTTSSTGRAQRTTTPTSKSPSPVVGIEMKPIGLFSPLQNYNCAPLYLSLLFALLSFMCPETTEDVFQLRRRVFIGHSIPKFNRSWLNLCTGTDLQSARIDRGQSYVLSALFIDTVR